MAEEKKDPMNTMEEEITEAKKQAAEEKEDTISTFKLRLKKPRLKTQSNYRTRQGGV